MNTSPANAIVGAKRGSVDAGIEHVDKSTPLMPTGLYFSSPDHVWALTRTGREIWQIPLEDARRRSNIATAGVGM